jgi:hypothetical protein
MTGPLEQQEEKEEGEEEDNKCWCIVRKRDNTPFHLDPRTKQLILGRSHLFSSSSSSSSSQSSPALFCSKKQSVFFFSSSSTVSTSLTILSLFHHKLS